MDHNIDTSKCIGKRVGESIKHYYQMPQEKWTARITIYSRESTCIILCVISLGHVYIAECTQQTVT